MTETSPETIEPVPALLDEADMDYGRQSADGEEVVVTGYRPTGDSGGGAGGGGLNLPDPGDTSLTPGEPTEPPPPTQTEIQCLTPEQRAALSPAEREKYDIAVEAAEAAREIMNHPMRDRFEFGAIIYRDANGVITHTPVAHHSSATSAPMPNMSGAGMPGWGSVLGYIHSHPAVTYQSMVLNLKVHPSPSDPTVETGDWGYFNWLQDQIAGNLVASSGYSEEDARSRANGLAAFVLGATGDVGTGSYGLHRYGDDDESRRRTTSDTQVAHSEKVSLALGQCGG